MYPVPGRCPVCGEETTVTRVYCRQCDTTVEGRFSLGSFHRLTPEQLQFAETFISCEGKITRVEEAMGLSYPAVRARLHDLIRALGHEVGAEPWYVIPPTFSPHIEHQRYFLHRTQGGRLSSIVHQRLS